MNRAEETNTATVKELLEGLSDAEIRELCINALRAWRRKHPTEGQFSVHGALGLEVVPLLLARKGRAPVDSNTLSGLKEPFITEQSQPWLVGVSDFLVWFTGRGYGNAISWDKQNIITIRLTRAGMRFLEGTEGNPQHEDISPSAAVSEAAKSSPAQELAGSSAQSSGVVRDKQESEGPALSGFDNDEARGGADQLDFKRDVAALAQLLAATEERGVKPPLSVGLFGDWGTGKTFFMDMLESQIDQLRASGETAFCERIVQIRFNAWHYMDANLWASLATHLFSELDRQLARNETAEQRDTRVKQQLASARAEAERLDREKLSLEAQLDTLRMQASDAEQTRRTRRLELADLRVVDVSAVLAANPDLAAKLSKLDEAVRAASTVRALFSRYTIAFLVATSVALAAGLYFANAVLSQVAAVVGSLLTAGAGAVGALRRAIPRSEELIALFAEIEARARARPSADEERVAREIATADLRYQELVGACSRLATDLARLEADKQQLADQRDFVKYVLQRNQSDEYRKQLGIVSTLQRDFDELSRRLLVDDRGARVQRIVLYIDDLDRCPADKVVQVLQAVHLLLSFPLFVVVVAVDPTWVLRSLADHYAKQMTGDGNDHIPAATPHAYLEKIFQIPMRVRPMEIAAYARLIDRLAGKQVAAEPSNRVDTAYRAEDVLRSELAAGPVTHDREAPPEQKLTGAALILEVYEVEYLKALGVLVPTPRAAKRLLNVYRLIRVQLTSAERTSFVRAEDGTFRAVMLFLALNARFPTASVELFDRIVVHKGKTWSELRKLLEPSQLGDEWRAMWTEISGIGPRTEMDASQLRNAATLAGRYSLPGPPLRRNDEVTPSITMN